MYLPCQQTQTHPSLQLNTVIPVFSTCSNSMLNVVRTLFNIGLYHLHMCGSAIRPSMFLYRVQEILAGSKHSLPTYCRPVVLPAHSLRSASVPSTPSLPSSSPQLTPSRPLTALHPQHFTPISPQLYLVPLVCLLDPFLLQQAAVRHVVIISSNGNGAGLTPASGKLPVLGDVLEWLLMEPDRARGLAVCSAGGVQCKIIPVQGQVCIVILSTEMGHSTCISCNVLWRLS